MITKLKIAKDIPSKIMIGISERNNSIPKIAKTINSTYAHVCNVMYLLEENKLINRTKIGRDKIIELTNKGKKVQELLKEIRLILK